MANRMDDVDSLHVEIENLNDPLVRFCFIRDIDSSGLK
jgi:acetoacetate decarboxylase